jgi:hypothetical protein
MRRRAGCPQRNERVWQQWEHSRNGARNISIHTAGNQWQHGSQHLTHPGGEITRHDSETAAQMDVIESGPSKGVTIELTYSCKRRRNDHQKLRNTEWHLRLVPTAPVIRNRRLALKKRYSALTTSARVDPDECILGHLKSADVGECIIADALIESSDHV